MMEIGDVAALYTPFGLINVEPANKEFVAVMVSNGNLPTIFDTKLLLSVLLVLISSPLPFIKLKLFVLLLLLIPA